jgi:hypothetical protein
MKKKFKGRTQKHSRSSHKERQFRTWSGISPILETEYPFESAFVAGEYNEFLQRSLGPGIRIYPSTACISTVDTIDALLLTLLGEQFREFYPGEIPWLSRTTAEMLGVLWPGENDTQEIDRSLARLAKQGFIELDRSAPGIYRYRLNLDTVRKEKNKHFVPMSELEQIEDQYSQRFPEPSIQKRAFTFICGRNVSLGRLMLNLWHLSLNETTEAAKRDPKKGLVWIDIEDFSAFRNEPLFESGERKQQALQALIQKGFLEVRQKQQNRLEYRPHAIHIWSALDALPGELLPITEIDGDIDVENGPAESTQ